MSTVLVTGGTGFIGSHVILQLLKDGHQVRTTMRNLKRESDLLAMLKVGGVTPGAQLFCYAADLMRDEGWSQAVAGCDFVHHIASPFPLNVPKDENELILPARDGALRVLRAARDAGVKRVVLTSSFAAVGYGHPPTKSHFDETDWTDLASSIPVPAYQKSKTIAERAAWDFLAREGGSLELAVVNPVGVFGPVLGPDFATSIILTQRLLNGDVPGCPNLSFGVVDVRDVVDLHLRAMIDPAANGQRFLAVAGESLSILDIANMYKSHMGAAAAKVPTRRIPDWLLRIAALFDAPLKGILPELGTVKTASNAKARRVLGWTPRSNEESILSTGESLLRLGLLKTSSKAA